MGSWANESSLQVAGGGPKDRRQLGELSALLGLASAPCRRAACAGLAGLFRGFRSQWRIAICSAKPHMSSRVRAAPALALAAAEVNDHRDVVEVERLSDLIGHEALVARLDGLGCVAHHHE